MRLEGSRAERGVAEQLLATKLLVPALGREVVPRPRLVERLSAASRRRLTVVAAPAGFGKTTAVAAWIAAEAPPVAWLALDEADNALDRFLLHLIGALRARWPEVGAGALAGLERQPLRPAAVLGSLLNELADGEARTLVLDEFEAIQAADVLDALAFLLEHQPSDLHVVVCTRGEPRLPLVPRWRARGQLEEVTADDLRFTAEEAAGFLNQAMALEMSAAAAAALHARTEGWIAGLQLAALSLRRTADRERFVETFAGDHRWVADYLIDEVLRRQSPEVQEFLLRTSILGRLHGALCDAVTGGADGQPLLERLAEQNLFVLRLDERRSWYRYHALFAELLRQRLAARDAGEERELHRRAAGWFERHGLPAEAVRHALAAGDADAAAGVVERHAREALGRGRGREVASWLAALPEEAFARRPALGVFQGMALLGAREVDLAARRLEQVERLLDGAPGAAPPDLRARLRLVQGGVHLFRGELAQAIARGEEAAALLGDERGRMDGSLETVLALGHHGRGELRASREFAEQGLSRALAADNARTALMMLALLARIDLEEGALRRSEAAARRALELAAERGWWEVGLRAAPQLVLAEALYERDALAEAEAAVAAAAEVATRGGPDELEDLAAALAARVGLARGGAPEAPPADPGRAARQGLHVRMFEPPTWHLARLRLARGDAAGVERALRDRGLDPHATAAAPEDEADELLLARALIGRGRAGEAVPLLGRLLLAAEAGGRRRAALEALCLLAVARHLQGATPAAQEALARALALCPGEPFVRLYLDLGAPMQALLARAVEAGRGGEAASALLAAFGAAAPAPAAVAPLGEPIRERELDVLRLIVAGCSNQEIAARLHLSPNTIKTHVRNLYGKLGAESRAQAIRRARELGLAGA
jgi:LuxR family maltose regulon positive regulatory protein